jgi:DNA polymerase-3 subunit gamma/tau
VRVLRRIADAEKIEAPDAALALIARGARGSFRDAVSTLDQLASATGNTIDVQSVLQLLGAVEEDALFRLCDAIVDRDTAGALVFLEELAEQGQDLGRLVTDLLEHLRHLLLVQHMGHVPDSLPVTDETRERLREQANQLPAPTVLRLCDLLAVAVEDSRQGADPRLPLELALVKVTSPGSDLSRESLAFRVEQLEQRQAGAPVAPQPVPPASAVASAPSPTPVAPQPPEQSEEKPPASGTSPPLALDQLQDAWQRTVLPAIQSRSIPVASLLGEAHPAALESEMLTLEFPATADFHRRQAEEPKNVSVIRDALYEVTGHRLGVTLELGAAATADEEQEDELTEDALISMFKDTFDAQEVEDTTR